MLEFPKICPNWVGDYKPPSRANAQQDFQDKSRSAIRLSNISTAGEFTAYFEKLTPKQSTIIWAFFAEVETVDTFSLPKKFFQYLHKDYEVRYRAISPSGLYRMEEPKETRLRNSLSAIEIRLRGEIL